MNQTLKTILIAFIVVWAYNKYSKEGFSYRNTPAVLTGYNNMVLTDPNGNLGSIQFPKGMIMIWTEGLNNIPAGWALCDGNNGTPNLMGKFLLGVTPSSDNSLLRTLKASGGNTKISVNQLPGHDHEYKDVYLMENEGYVRRNVGDTYSKIEGDSRMWGTGSNLDWDNDAMGKIKKTGSTGSGEDYYPPFVTVAYIMKL